MLIDLSPYGQYGDIDPIGYTVDDELSIFHVNTELRNENGLSAYYQGAQFSYPYQALDGSIVDLDPADYSLEEFVTIYWQESWEEQFLPYHPEYCYYLLCNNESADFDRDFHEVTTASEAISLGYIGANGMMTTPLLLTVDPQFSSGGLLQSETQRMIDQMLNMFHDYPASANASSQSAYDMAISSVCLGITAQYNAGSLPAPAPANCLSTYGVDHPDPAIADQVWQAYKGLYISTKQRLEHLTMSELNQTSCLNRCIGRDTSTYSLPSIVFGDQPCNSDYAILFADKQKVFPSANDIPGLEGVEDLYDYDLLEHNLDVIFDAIDVGLTDSLSCGITGTWPPILEDTSDDSQSCITYDCISELPAFLNQLIPANSPAGDSEFLSDQLVDVPACFGGSPFLQYAYLDAQHDDYYNGGNLKHTYLATIGSAAADPAMCQVLFSFYVLPAHPIDPSLVDEHLYAISQFNDLKLDTDFLDQFSESNHFFGTATSVFGGQNTLVGVKGYISCAKLGRCCGDGVEAGIEACLDIPNVDNPSSTEEELWIGERNPYFDPLWLKNPCDTMESPIVEVPSITCTDDTLGICCQTDSIIPGGIIVCLLYTSPSPRDKRQSRMPSSA